MSSVKNKTCLPVEKKKIYKAILGAIVPLISTILIGALLAGELKKKSRSVSGESDDEPTPKKTGIYNFRRKAKVPVRPPVVRRASDPGLPLKRKLVLVKKSK